MIVKYSSLNRLEKPVFTLCNPGSVYSEGLLSKVVGILADTEAEEIVFNFNATSEFNLRVNRIVREDPKENAHTYALYKAVQNRRLIFVEDIGYFVITNIADGFDGHIHYKDITAKSVDAEIGMKMIPFVEDGTYRFSTDKTGENRGMLERIVETLPLWTIEHIDDAVAKRWRTFEGVDTSLDCLSFLLQNMQDAYECIFVFDNIQRTISVYDQANYVRQTNIHITKDDLINSLEVTENADDLFTAVSVAGDENVTISAINPIGTNVIYDFSYYLEWMSDELRAKVVAWQKSVEDEKDSYYDLNLRYYNKLTEISNLQMEIQKLDTQITMYRRCRDNIVAENSTELVKSYNEVIAENGGTQIAIQDEVKDTLAVVDKLIAECENTKRNTQATLDTKQTELDLAEGQIDAVRKKLAVTSYFTEDEYTELCHYIFEGSYSDDYVVITDIMSYDEKFAQMKTLYDRAVSQLKRTSQPTKEFSVDVENFVFAKEFEKWSEQLETGCLINVELDIDDVAALFLSNMTINYDDHSLGMTFGNRFNKFDPKSLYEDTLGQISKSANTLSYIKETIYPIKSGEFDYMREALQTSRNLTMGAALASTNEKVVIDGSGYTGRQLLDSGEYDPRQVKLVSNRLVFTNDGWESSDVVLGEILLDDGSKTYGINARTLMGEAIIGERLRLSNSGGNLSFTGDGLEVTNGINTFVVNPNADGLLSISKGASNLLYVDTEGNLHISGEITATAGTIGKCTIDAEGNLQIKNANIAEKITAKNIDAASLTVDGAQIKDGTISSAKISELSATKITSGTLDASKVTVKDLSASVISSGTLDAGKVTVKNLSAGSITGGTLDAGKITVKNLSADSITSGVFDAGKMTVKNLSADSITGGKLSGDFIDGASLNITKGATIAGWSIDENSIYTTYADDASRVFMCTGTTNKYKIGGYEDNWYFGAGTSEGSGFGVSTSGVLCASGAKISGEIHATEGTIGGWTLDDEGRLYATDSINGLKTVLHKDGIDGYYMTDTGEFVPVGVTWVGLLTAIVRS